MQIKNFMFAKSFRGLICGVFGVAAALLPVNHASAQNYTNADTVYSGWIAAYVVNSNSTGGSYFVNTLTNRSEAYLWGEAYMIWGAEDAYNKNHSPDRKAFVNSVVTHFISNNGTLSGTPANTDAGTDTFIVSVTDSAGNSSTAIGFGMVMMKWE